MQVIMTQTAELKQVADGYARNYLFPRKLATPATADAVKASETQRAAYQAQQTQLKADQLAAAAKLKGLTVKVAAKANAEGTLFAAVTAEEVAQAMQAQGVSVGADQLQFSPIKKVGNHNVVVQWSKADSATLTLQVEAKQ